MTTGISPWPPIQWLAKCNLIASKPCLECSWSYLNAAYNKIDDDSPVWDYAAWLGRFSIVVLQRIPVIGKIMDLAKKLFCMSNECCQPTQPTQPAAAAPPPPLNLLSVTSNEIKKAKDLSNHSCLIGKACHMTLWNGSQLVGLFQEGEDSSKFYIAFNNGYYFYDLKLLSSDVRKFDSKLDLPDDCFGVEGDGPFNFACFIEKLD